MRRMVLIGAGHAHALVLHAWPKTPASEIELVLVAPVACAPYSGMIPGWLAGQYGFEQSVVNFRVLCQRAGAKLIQGELARLDPDANTVWLTDGQRIDYDWLSLNVGSTLTPPDSDRPMLAMRPLSMLKSRYEARLSTWKGSPDTSTFNLTAAGGGAAGIESVLCIKHQLQQLRPDRTINARVITRGKRILPGFSDRARRLTMKALRKANVSVELDTDWSEAIAKNSDLIIWATGAQAHEWQTDPARRGRLQTDSSGFIAVDHCLRSLSHANVFAVGDCAALPKPIPKAGVYAVRMGGTLLANLHAAVHRQPLRPFNQDGIALALLNIADGTAIASWGPLGWQGKWVMRWKDQIDRGFIAKLGRCD